MGLNADALKKRSEQMSQGGDSIYAKLATGRNVVRVLPRSLAYFSPQGDNDFAYTTYYHYRLFNVDGYRRIICKRTHGHQCPICAFGDSLTDKVAAKKFYPTSRYMLNVLDYDSGKIKVLEVATTVYEEVLKYIIDPSWGDSLLAIKNGRDVIVEVEAIPENMKGKKNPYSVKMVPNQTDITELLPEKWDELIDGLVGRVPTLHEEAFYLKAVECLRTNTLPEPIKKEKKEEEEDTGEAAPAVKAQAAQAAPVTTAAPAAAKPVITKPACFGLEYSPRLEKCKPCAVKIECRSATLKI